MKALIRNAILLGAPAILIVLAYSPSTYFRYFDFPFLVTFSSYVIVYVLVLGISVVIAPMLARRLTKISSVRAIVQAITGTVGFAVLALVCAKTWFDVPHTRVNGIFFSEWKFMNFFFYVGLPAALTSAATAFLSDEEPPSQVEAP